MLQTKCPHCQQIFDVEENFLGQEVECTSCKNTFVVIRYAQPGQQVNYAQPGQQVNYAQPGQQVNYAQPGIPQWQTHDVQRKNRYAENVPVSGKLDAKVKKKLNSKNHMGCLSFVMIFVFLAGVIGYFIWQNYQKEVKKRHTELCLYRLQICNIIDKDKGRYLPYLLSPHSDCPIENKSYVYLGNAINITKSDDFPIAFCRHRHSDEDEICVRYANGISKSVYVGKKRRRPVIIAEYLLEKHGMDKSDPRWEQMIKNAEDYTK